MTVSLRAATAADSAQIDAVHAAAFPTTAEAALVAALRTAQRLTVSWVAEQPTADGALQVIGHIAFSPVSVAGSLAGLGLAPLAVLPAHQRQGVGGRLVQAGVAAAREAGAAFVVVLGEPAYYGRFGFRPAAEWGLSDEYGGGAAFQVLELGAGGVPRGAGLVRYAPEFSLVAET